MNIFRGTYGTDRIDTNAKSSNEVGAQNLDDHF
jgi:hypothetical protein